MIGEYGIVANVTGADPVLRDGAKVWLVGGENGDGFLRRRVMGLNVGGRIIEKWCQTKRLTNLRAAWIPPSIPKGKIYPVGDRASMEEVAASMSARIAELATK